MLSLLTFLEKHTEISSGKVFFDKYNFCQCICTCVQAYGMSRIQSVLLTLFFFSHLLPELKYPLSLLWIYFPFKSNQALLCWPCVLPAHHRTKTTDQTSAKVSSQQWEYFPQEDGAPEIEFPNVRIDITRLSPHTRYDLKTQIKCWLLILYILKLWNLKSTIARGVLTGGLIWEKVFIINRPAQSPVYPLSLTHLPSSASACTALRDIPWQLHCAR